MSVEPLTDNEIERLRRAGALYLNRTDVPAFEAALAELQLYRNAGRHAARQTVMVMASAIASELTHEMHHKTPEERDELALRAVQIALAVEKATPR